MAGQVLLIADRSEAVIQAGQPSAQMGAWLLDIPDGSDATATAANFAGSQAFPIGTTARVIDLADPSQPLSAVMAKYRLSSQWVPVSD